MRPGICLSLGLEGETGLLDACMKDRLSHSVGTNCRMKPASQPLAKCRASLLGEFAILV